MNAEEIIQAQYGNNGVPEPVAAPKTKKGSKSEKSTKKASKKSTTTAKKPDNSEDIAELWEKSETAKAPTKVPTKASTKAQAKEPQLQPKPEQKEPPDVTVTEGTFDLSVMDKLEKEQADRLEGPLEDSVRWRDVVRLRNFKPYEWLAVIPAIFLGLNGGLLGAGMGFFSLLGILKIIRKPRFSINKKIVLILILTLIYYAIYLALVSMLMSVVKVYLPYEELM